MTLTIEAGGEFEDSLKEFHLLLEAALEAEGGGEGGKYAVYLKCALLLLTSKFECFLEELVEEVAIWIRRESIPCSMLPIEIATHYTHQRSMSLEMSYNQFKFNDIKNAATALARFWLDHDSSDLEIDCKFSYGKHGEKEVVKLLRRIGVSTPFDVVSVEVETPDGSSQKVDMAGVINSLTSIRNNVLHQNASPQLTHHFLSEQHSCLLQFSKGLVIYVETLLARTQPGGVKEKTC